MQQKHLEELLNVDLDELNKKEEINDQNYLPKSDNNDSNNIFKYIKDNSLLKQANYFLEKEKKDLEKEIQNLSEKCGKYKTLISNLERSTKDQEIELLRYQN